MHGILGHSAVSPADWEIRRDLGRALGIIVLDRPMKLATAICHHAQYGVSGEVGLCALPLVEMARKRENGNATMGRTVREMRLKQCPALQSLVLLGMNGTHGVRVVLLVALGLENERGLAMEGTVKCVLGPICNLNSAAKKRVQLGITGATGVNAVLHVALGQ